MPYFLYMFYWYVDSVRRLCLHSNINSHEQHAQLFPIANAIPIDLSNPCTIALCPSGTTCEVIDGKAACTGPGDTLPDLPDLLEGDNICARVDLQCPIPGSACRVVNGKPTCVPPPGAQDPCDTAPCGPATGTVCVAVGGKALCVPNTIG
jgi:hypothetical protein